MDIQKRSFRYNQEVKNNKEYIIEFSNEIHTYKTTYDILQNHYNYPTVCLLLDTAHRIDHCITVCGKCIFDSNLESSIPLKKASLNYICSGNDTDEITFVGVLHAIIEAPPVVFQKRLKI